MTASRFAALRVSRLACVFAGVILVGTAQAQQQSAPAQQATSAPDGRVVVIGEGSVSVAPDYAQISGGVTTRGKSVKEATDANSKLMAAITSAFVDAGVAQRTSKPRAFRSSRST